MRKISPITKLVLNGKEIVWGEYDDSFTDAENLAYELRLGGYPTYLVSEIEERYGEQEWDITVSNHIKYKQSKNDHPEWFDYENYKRINGEFVRR